MNKRLTFLREQYGFDLLSSFRTDRRNAPFQKWTVDAEGRDLDDKAAGDIVFDRYRAADPTRTGACTQWLIRLAIAGHLPVEDLVKAKETLAAFRTYKGRLTQEARDLGRHETLGSVWKAVEPFVLANAPVSAKDEDRREREASRAESTILLEEGGLTIAIPHTERAAKWWGRGTRWCTAADRDNMFEFYDDDAPLVVFVLPDGSKYQGTNGGYDERMFMDAADDPADFDLTMEPWRDLLIERLPAMLHALDSDWIFPRTRQVIVEAIARYGLPYTDLRSELGDYAPDECPAGDVYGEAFSDADLVLIARRSASVVKEVERPLPVEVYLSAVREDPSFLTEVPEAMLDEELCEMAMEQNGSLLELVPQALRTRRVCLAAVRSSSIAMDDVPTELLDEDMICAALENHGDIILDFPEEQRTKAMWLAAVTSCGRLMCDENFPAEYKTPEFALAALPQCLEAISALPENDVTEEFCRQAIAANPIVLGEVLERYADRSFIRQAVLINPHVARHIPQRMLDPEFALELALSDLIIASHMPVQIWDGYEFVARLIDRYGADKVDQCKVEAKYNQIISQSEMLRPDLSAFYGGNLIRFPRRHAFSEEFREAFSQPVSLFCDEMEGSPPQSIVRYHARFLPSQDPSVVSDDAPRGP